MLIWHHFYTVCNGQDMDFILSTKSLQLKAQVIIVLFALLNTSVLIYNQTCW